nr:MAG TPA: hypothetical protein [Caudoviricetes sp.]
MTHLTGRGLDGPRPFRVGWTHSNREKGDSSDGDDD